MAVITLHYNGKGNFDVRNFGAKVAGTDAQTPFEIVAATPDGKLNLRIMLVTCSLIFERLDPTGRDYIENAYSITDFLKTVPGSLHSPVTLITKTKALFFGLKSLCQHGSISNSSAFLVNVVHPKCGAFKIEPTPTKKAA